MEKPSLNETSLAMKMKFSKNEETVCIFGTGDFGKSLAYKMLQCGYTVVFGSRKPEMSNMLSKGVEVLTHAEAARRSDIIVIAIHRDHYEFLTELADELKGKILVDVSNNLKINQYPESNAEYLAELLPGAKIVKAFNTLSAWALQSGTVDANRQVFICGDDKEAKQRVMIIGRTLGLTPLDQGSLKAANEIENYPLQLFPMWKFPFCFAAAFCVSYFIYSVIREIVYCYIQEKKDFTFFLALSVATHIFPGLSLNLLALVYLPGLFAAILQLSRGTKYSRFPNWLDYWMRCRKQLGLAALAFAFLHLLYVLVFPMRFYIRWENNRVSKQKEKNDTIPFDTTHFWIEDSYIALGILGLFFFVLLGITSLPSVNNMINWREFLFVQSKLGYLTLILSTAHTLLFGKMNLQNSSLLRWYLPPTYMFALIIPCLVLVLKFILIMPCFDRPLMKIRQGWERNPKNSPKEAQLENAKSKV